MQNFSSLGSLEMAQNTFLVGGRVGGCGWPSQLRIMLFQPSLAGVGAWTELGNRKRGEEEKSWMSPEGDKERGLCLRNG